MKLIHLLPMAAAMLLLASCEDELMPLTGGVEKNTRVLSASFSDEPQSRLALGEAGKASWTDGDVIILYDGKAEDAVPASSLASDAHFNVLTLTSDMISEDGSTATISTGLEGDLMAYACDDFNSIVEISADGTPQTRLPNSSSGTSVPFFATASASGEELSLSFSHNWGLLKMQCSAAEYKVVVSGNGSSLTADGDFTCDVQGLAAGTSFYACVAPGTWDGGLTFNVYKNSSAYTSGKPTYIINADGAVTVGAGKCLNFGDLLEHKTVVTISSVSPVIVTEGDVLTITGTGFSEVLENNQVKVGGVYVNVLEATSTTLKVEIPKVAKGDRTAIVYVLGCDSVTSGKFKYYELPEYEVSTLVGNGTNDNVDGTGTAASISLTETVTIGPDGYLWVTTRGGSGTSSMHSVRKVDLSTGEMSAVVESTGNNTYPWGGAFNSKGEFHVALKGNNTIGKATPLGDGTYEWSTYSISGLETAIKAAMCVIFDENDNMYLADRDNYRVIKCDSEGNYLAEWNIAYSSTSLQPYTLAYNSNFSKKYIFVGLNGGYRIMRLNIDTGACDYVGGTGTKVSSSNFNEGYGVTPKKTPVGSVSGMYLTDEGYLYFNDVTAQTLRVFIPGSSNVFANGIIRTVAGINFANAYADGDALTEAKFKAQGLLTMDSSGNLYVPDANYRIRKVSPK